MKQLAGQLEHLSPTKLRLIVHVCGVLVTAGILSTGYFLVSTSSKHQETDWQASIDADRELIAQREAVVAARERAECELFAMTQRLDELTALIPHTPDESRFLAELAELAGTTGLVIQNFRPGPPEEAGSPTDGPPSAKSASGKESSPLQRIRVNLSGAGSYDGICRFLDGLQALPRLTHVSRLNVTPQTGSQLYPVELELSIFFAATTTRVARR